MKIVILRLLAFFSIFSLYEPVEGQCLFPRDSIVYFGNRMYTMRVEGTNWHLIYDWKVPYYLDVSGKIYIDNEKRSGVLIPNRLDCPLFFKSRYTNIKDSDSVYLVVSNVYIFTKDENDRSFILVNQSAKSTEQIKIDTIYVRHPFDKSAQYNDYYFNEADTTMTIWSDTISIYKPAIGSLKLIDSKTQRSTEIILLGINDCNLYQFDDLEFLLYMNNLMDVSKEFSFSNDLSTIQLNIRGRVEILNRYFDTSNITELFSRCPNSGY